MTLVTGTVQDLGYDGMEGTLWARPARFRSDGQVVLAPERKPFKITGGVVSAELAPGPAVLELQVGSHARGTFEVVIPEAAISLADLLDRVFPWEPEQVSQFVAERELAVQAKTAAETAAGQASTAAGTATTAAQQTGQDRTAVAADKQVVVGHVQALAAPNDAAVLGLISEGATTQTKAALNATYGLREDIEAANAILEQGKLSRIEADSLYVTPGQVPALVADAIAADGTVAASAAAAVGQAIYNERTSKNLVNKDDPDVLVDQVPNVSAAGTYTALADYNTSGYIPVTVGVTYTIQNVRYYEWFNASKVSTGVATNTGLPSATVTVTAPADGFLRVSWQRVTNPNIQAEVGSAATAYEPWFAGTRQDVDPQFAASVAAAITPFAGPLSVTRSGDVVSIDCALGDTTLVRTSNMSGSNNGAFTFTGVAQDGVSLSTVTDDITPIRTQLGAVGAGHGYPNIGEFTNPDGKTAADLGSVWTDGTREYVLLAIAASGKLVVGGSHTLTDGVVTSAVVAPTTNLTHVSGATHTGDIVHTTRTAGQLFPSIGRKSIRLLLDGQEFPSGNARATEVVVTETYDILDYAALYDTAKANPGVSYATLDVAGCVRVTNTFRFRGPLCRVSTSYTELAPTTLRECGSLQALVHSRAEATTKHYLPGVGEVGGFNWSDGVEMAGYSANVNITPASLTGTQPPAMALDVLSVSGSPVVGFAFGYLPFGARGDEASRNDRRLTKAPSYLWRVAAFKKSYPVWTLHEPAGWGRLTAEGFRCYLPPSKVAAVLASRGNAVTAWDALGLDQ